MSDKAGYFRLGVFVIIALTLTVTGVTMLGAGAFFRQVIKAETYMKESVDGLTVGAAVKLRGVQVGTVSKIGFVANKYPEALTQESVANLGGFVLVELNLSPQERSLAAYTELVQSAIPRGLHARLASSGLMGAAYVELVFLPEGSIPTLEFNWKPDSIYIPAAPSVMAQITDAVEHLVKTISDANIDGLSAKAARLVDSLDKAVSGVDVKKIQDEAVALIEEVRASNASLQKILNDPNIGQTLANTASATGTIKQAADRIDALLNDPETKSLLANASKTAAAAGPAADELRQVLRRVDSLISTQSSNLESAVSSLKDGLENIRVLTEEARYNPSRLLFGDPPPKGKDTTGSKK